MTKTQSDCILNGCFIKPMNENIAVLLPVHSPRWVLGIGIRMHWEKCGEILFFSKILCFLEKSLLSFREKSYFFEKNVISRKILFFQKKTIFSPDFPSMYTAYTMSLLYNNCFLIATRRNSKEAGNGPKREGFL